MDLALPRGSWPPVTWFAVRWHHFDPATIDIGRQTLEIDNGGRIGPHSAQRSIIDAFRMRHLEGVDMASEAVKRWLRRGQPSELLPAAKAFRQVLAPCVRPWRSRCKPRVAGRPRGQAHLDLQQQARASGGPTDGLIQLDVLKGFLARLAGSPARQARPLGRSAAGCLRGSPPDPRRRPR